MKIVYIVTVANIEREVRYEGSSFYRALRAYFAALSNDWEHVSMQRDKVYDEDELAVGATVEAFEWRRLAALIGGIAGFGVVWYYASFVVAFGIWAMLFANNLERESRK